MKQSTANEEKEDAEKNEQLDAEELFVEEDTEDLEDLDLMSPALFIETLSNSYLCRKHTGRSRLKLHPGKITIKNYW